MRVDTCSLPQDIQTTIASFLNFDLLIAHRSFRKFLSEFVRLNKSGSEKEAVDSFYKHNKAKIDATLSHPYFNSMEFLAPLFSNQPLPASVALDELHALSKAHLHVLWKVNVTIASFLSKPGSRSIDLCSSGISDLSPLSGLTGLEELYLS